MNYHNSTYKNHRNNIFEAGVYNDLGKQVQSSYYIDCTGFIYLSTQDWEISTYVFSVYMEDSTGIRNSVTGSRSA